MKFTGIIATVILVLASLFSSCTGQSAHEKISAAEVALQAADYETAQVIASGLCNNDSIQRLGCNNLCRLSIIFMQLSERQNEEENVASATNCYHYALLLNADSAQAFYSALPIDEVRFVSVLNELNKYYDLDPDSIYIYDNEGFELDSLNLSDNE